MQLPKLKIYGIDVVKNLLFFILFLLITLLFVAFLISPAIKNFKDIKTNYYQKKYEFEVTTKVYKQKLQSLNALKNKNRKILNVLKRDFNTKNFKLFASKYMQITSIKEINSTDYKGEFLKTTYIVQSKITSPKNFYDFIDALKNYKSLLRVYFPIDFIKNNDSSINLTLKLEHYKLKPKNEH